MKQILLIIIILTIHLSVFARNLSEYNSIGNTINFEEKGTAPEVKIYPNPCQEEKVTIEFNKKEIKEIRLINITGKEVLLKKYDFSETKKQVELIDIPNGIYLIRIITSDQTVVVKKLMVSRN